MPYDPETELTPTVILSRLPHIFVVNAKVEAKTLKDLVDYAKANPGKLSAGVPGVGTTAHITLEAFMKMRKLVSLLTATAAVSNETSLRIFMPSGIALTRPQSLTAYSA